MGATPPSTGVVQHAKNHKFKISGCIGIGVIIIVLLGLKKGWFGSKYNIGLLERKSGAKEEEEERTTPYARA